MKREQTIRRRLMSLGMLRDTVDAMKSLSAHHLRLARTGLASAREYREGIDRLLASAGIAQRVPNNAHRPALLLVAADLGLCNGYNQQLVAATLAEQRARPGIVYCMGRRPLPALRRAGIELERSYPAAPSVDGLTRVLLMIADDVLGDYLRKRFGTLTVVSARFDGVGVFTPVLTRVLPVQPALAGVSPAATPYVERAVLVRVAVREYLYSTLYELLLDALAAEHGTRLVATQSAGQWLDEKIRGLRHQLAGVRQEAGTQEVLDVAAGARLRRRC